MALRLTATNVWGLFSLTVKARDLLKFHRPWERRAAPDLPVGPQLSPLSESADAE
jgi:hypothetical protein